MWADWIAALLAHARHPVLRPSASRTARQRRAEDAERRAASVPPTIAVLSAAYLHSPQAQGVVGARSRPPTRRRRRRLIPVRVAESG